MPQRSGSEGEIRKTILGNRHAFLWLPVPLFFFVVTTSVIGVDFGDHWDEPVHISSIQNSIKSGVLLPGNYIYPSMCHFLGLANLLPIACGYTCNIHKSQEPDIQTFLINYIGSNTYQLQLRCFMSLVSALTVIWVFVLVLVWQRNSWEAFLAAALVGLSWEVSYHSRWFTPDPLMMQFGALVMMFLVFSSVSTHPERWLGFASVAAGLAAGSKYTAGALFAPILATVYISKRKQGHLKLLNACSKIIVVFGIAYLISTPGTILEPGVFLGGLRQQRQAYSTFASGFLYDVHPGTEHLKLMVEYAMLAMFSRYSLISIFFSSMTLIGFYSLYKDNKSKTMSFVLFPFLYVSFLASYKLMFARNLIILIPCLAILSAHGIIFLQTQFFKRNSIYFTLFVCSLLLINAVWLVRASFSIRDRFSENYVAEASDYIDAHPHLSFLLSNKMQSALDNWEKIDRKNVIHDSTAHFDQAILFSSEIPVGTRIANRFNYVRRWFGPYDVNFNYYPNWMNNDPILVMREKNARATGIFG